MAGDDRPPQKQRDVEDLLLRRLRVIAATVVLVMIVLLVTVDTFARLFVDRDFQASGLFLGTLVGALIILLGIETVASFPGWPRK